MRWMVIYEYEVPGGALNLSSTKLPSTWSPIGIFPFKEKSPWQSRESNPGHHDHVGGNYDHYDHEAGPVSCLCIQIIFSEYFYY
jgi:hypothetical protein